MTLEQTEIELATSRLLIQRPNGPTYGADMPEIPKPEDGKV